ncbi:hypothetical protein dsx2_0844 [Desulfovibrio sp. X2]|uniref:thioredoxin family protein n=1 Tax=Desulfovibrio sp. X2 TaxID=941449 RepID=UPI00035892FC|nr:thioredoxin family protein [Desulfovibrio sp. X2]EPR37498.1 hypothetical protein dsx2_0844 [Desulfovibrio sp. X2]
MIFMPDVSWGIDSTAQDSDGATPVLVACLGSRERAAKQLEALGMVAERFGERLQVVILGEDEMPAARSRFNVLGTPTFLLYHGGKERDRYLGEAGSGSLCRFVQECLGGRSDRNQGFADLSRVL